MSYSLCINPNLARLRCSLSGKEQDAHGFTRPVGLCACCPPPGRPVLVEYDLEKAAGALDTATGRGLWRHAALLPVLGPPAAYADDVGLTPVERHEALSYTLGVEVLIKNEGANPSGSFKDRGLAVAVALGKASGARRFCLPTQGNAGVAASLFSARLGLEGCLVTMPESHRGGIYHRSAAFFNAEVSFHGANIAAAGRHMREIHHKELASGSLVDLSTFFEPGRLEGKKTMGLELVAELGPDGLPDFILYPTGGGTGLVGIWKAFAELLAMGRLDPGRHRLPRMVAVQSENCAPVVRAFEAELEQVEPVESRGTIADGLDVPGAIMGHGILQAIRASSGTALAVSEEAILEAFRECGRHGLAVGYESAALVAALGRLCDGGTVTLGSTVLLLCTSTQLISLASKP